MIMSTSGIARSIAAACLGLALCGAPTLAHAATAAAHTAVAAESAAPTSPEARERTKHYAERQAANPQASEFQGKGVGVYIGGSTLAVVLVIVLIVVLL
jgi:hypothetical protein